MYELIFILLFIGSLMYFSYSAGKTKAVSKKQEESIDAITKAIEARNSVKSVDDAKRLLMEYSD